MQVDAIFEGEFGHAWGGRGQEPGQAWGAWWVVEARWAHPVWWQYAVLLYDMTTPVAGEGLILHLPGATHEFHLYALDPDEVVPRHEPPGIGSMLAPPNMGYQFIAASHHAARGRINQVIAGIIDNGLNPDADNRAAWDALFWDGHPLVRSAFGRWP